MSTEKFTAGNAISQGFSTLRQAPVSVLGAALIYSVPATVFSAWVQALAQAQVQAGVDKTANPFAAMTRVLAIYGNPQVLAASLVLMLLSLVVHTAVTKSAVQSLSGQKTNLLGALGSSIGLIFPLIGLFICVGFLTALGWLLIFIPGVYLALRWSLVLPVRVTEGAGIGRSMKRSAHLTKDYRWSLLLMFILAFLVQLLFGAVIGAIAVAIKFTVSDPILKMIIAAVVQAPFTALLLGFTYSTLSAAYVQLRQQKDGSSAEGLASVFS